MQPLLQGRVVLFRPDANAQRMAEGAARMSMVAPPQELFLEAVKQVGVFVQLRLLLATRLL